ncbi:hypothetical protein ACJX0J_005412, partial [Zea mays]
GCMLFEFYELSLIKLESNYICIIVATLEGTFRGQIVTTSTFIVWYFRSDNGFDATDLLLIETFALIGYNKMLEHKYQSNVMNNARKGT